MLALIIINHVARIRSSDTGINHSYQLFYIISQKSSCKLVASVKHSRTASTLNSEKKWYLLSCVNFTDDNRNMPEAV